MWLGIQTAFIKLAFESDKWEPKAYGGRMCRDWLNSRIHFQILHGLNAYKNSLNNFRHQMSPLMAELLIPLRTKLPTSSRSGGEIFWVGLDTLSFTQLLIFKSPFSDQNEQIFIPSGAWIYNPGVSLTFDRTASGNFGTSQSVIRYDVGSERADGAENGLEWSLRSLWSH